VLNFAAELLPRWIVIENVIQMRDWKGYGPLIAELEDLDYNVLPVTLDARDFGVPQQRRRLFLLCDREGDPLPPVPVSRREAGTVADILDPPGTWKSTPLRREGRAKPTIERAERAIAALGAGVPFLIVYYGSDAGGGWQTVDRPLRTITTIDRFGLVTWEGTEPYLRMLQVPELMRAMGFSGDYSLDGADRDDGRIRSRPGGLRRGLTRSGAVARNAASTAANAPDLMSHSQRVRTSQPSSASAFRLRASRSTLADSFARHQSCRVLGSTAFRQPGSECRCQKQPWTNTTLPKRGKTRSGRPGKSRL
jgi:hypothetical protein